MYVEFRLSHVTIVVHSQCTTSEMTKWKRHLNVKKFYFLLFYKYSVSDTVTHSDQNLNFPRDRISIFEKTILFVPSL